jgi:hypothetical protein
MLSNDQLELRFQSRFRQKTSPDSVAATFFERIASSTKAELSTEISLWSGLDVEQLLWDLRHDELLEISTSLSFLVLSATGPLPTPIYHIEQLVH